MIRATVNTEPARRTMQAIADGITRERTTQICQGVALRTFQAAVQATPVRFFGQVRASWQFIPTQTGAIIRNPNKIFLFIDQGTANQGAGYIYPKVKKFLFVALTRAAAGGWHAGLVRGVDYILKKKVRGIKPIHLMDRLRAFANAALKQEFKNYIRELIRNPQRPPQAGLASAVPDVLQSPGALPNGLVTGAPATLFQQPKLPFLR
jgi:hypothetical protein